MNDDQYFLVGRDMILTVDGQFAEMPGLLTRVTLSPIVRNEAVTISLDYVPCGGVTEAP